MTILGWIICAMMMAGASSCGVWNAILTMEMTDRVNQGLAPDKQFPVLAQGLRYFGFGASIDINSRKAISWLGLID